MKYFIKTRYTESSYPTDLVNVSIVSGEMTYSLQHVDGQLDRFTLFEIGICREDDEAIIITNIDSPEYPPYKLLSATRRHLLLGYADIAIAIRDFIGDDSEPIFIGRKPYYDTVVFYKLFGLNLPNNWPLHWLFMDDSLFSDHETASIPNVSLNNDTYWMKNIFLDKATIASLYDGYLNFECAIQFMVMGFHASNLLWQNGQARMFIDNKIGLCAVEYAGADKIYPSCLRRSDVYSKHWIIHRPTDL